MLQRVVAVTQRAVGLGLAVILALWGASPAAACSCMRLTIDEYVTRADLVALADVTAVEDVAEGVSLYTFRVSALWKGKVDDPERVRVLSASSGATCGLEGITKGDQVALFAQSTHPGPAEDVIAAWKANLCGGTAPAQQRVPDLMTTVGPPRILTTPTGQSTEISGSSVSPTPLPSAASPSGTMAATSNNDDFGVPSAAIAITAAVATGAVALILMGRRPRQT